MTPFQGLVIRAQSGFFLVQSASGADVICQLRGRLKRGAHSGDMVAIGDQVEFSIEDSGEGVIETVLPRRSLFTRMAPNPSGEYQQILLANLDMVAIIFACEQPAPRLTMLDRFLVIAERQGIPPLIIANKVDLVGLEHAQELFGHYASLGYDVQYLSAHSGLGVAQLRTRLQGQVTLFTGPSGVGKSTLLNALQPGLGLAANTISQATNKGRHTTVVRELFPLNGGGWVADTPGLKALALWDIEPEEIDAYFPELRQLVSQCQFSDCTHIHEPGCAVLQALEQGLIYPMRYESYRRLRLGDEDE